MIVVVDAVDDDFVVAVDVVDVNVVDDDDDVGATCVVGLAKPAAAYCVAARARCRSTVPRGEIKAAAGQKYGERDRQRDRERERERESENE